jgi:HD superfamily phosphohydrolase
MSGDRRPKLLRDPIYGYVELPVRLLPIIGSRQFQRLR